MIVISAGMQKADDRGFRTVMTEGEQASFQDLFGYALAQMEYA